MKRNIAFIRVLPWALLVLVAGVLSAATWKAPSFRARKKSPAPATAQSINIGKTFYLRECISCHGQTGQGDGPAAKDLATAPGNLADAALWKQSDGALFWKVSEGRSPMPGFKSLLDKEQRWHVINYLRTLSPKPPVFDVPEPHRQAVSKTLTSYFKVSSDLFGDDAGAARETLKSLTVALNDLLQITSDELDEQARAAWNDATQQLRTAMSPLAEAQDLAALRSGFKTLSNAMSHLLDQFGHNPEHPVYQLRCDQASGNEEVAWLQSDPEPKNPYRGQSESPCGTVILQWRKQE